MKNINVLVVDDAAVMRRIVSNVIDQEDDLRAIGVAANGRIALSKHARLRPDLITLDVEMPEMDGIETIRELRKVDRSTPIIMLSSLTKTGAEKTFEALAAGATDYLPKPSNALDFANAMDDLRRRLIPRIRALVPNSEGTPKTSPARLVAKRAVRDTSQTVNALCIGTSTGGPNALEQLLKGFRDPLPVPTFIVQHMPPVFTKTLADRLDKVTPNKVVEGEHGQLAEKGHIYIAPGGKHMEVVQQGSEICLNIHDGPLENSCRPAVDVLLRSVAKLYGNAAFCAILTGMGQDGLRGCEWIHDAGGRIIVQDESSSVVWGMPRVVWEAELAEEAFAIDALSEAIMSRIGRVNAGKN